MSGTAQNNWNGDIIGESVGVTVYELDTYSQQTTETESTSSRITNTFNLAYNVGITIPKLVNIGVKASYTYSNTVTNAQSETLVTRYDKDIKVMDFRLFYCDEDLTYPDPTGVPGNTWYGHIPGIYTNDPNQPVGAQMLYQEFRVENN